MIMCPHPDPLCIEEDCTLTCEKCGERVQEVVITFRCVVNPRSKRELAAARKACMDMLNEGFVNE